MEQQDNMNWDKLLRQMERGSERQHEEELNQEELEMLLLAEEINMRIKEEDPMLKFPVQEGWEELKERHREKTRQTRRLKLYRTLSIAAVILMLFAPAWWFLRPTKTTATSGNDQVQLTMANGETVELDSSKSDILKTEGASIKGVTLVYKRETKLPEANAELHFNEVYVPKGKFTRLELGDGTSVWLNAGSKLSYTVPFAAHKREVSLDGEAYFDVSHNSERPFVIHHKALSIQVLGTAFSINTFGKVVNTALERGKVNLQAGSETLILLPGDLGVYDPKSNSLTKSEEDLRLYTAWKDQDVYFNNNTLEEITTRLAREYDVSFVFEEESLKNLHFTIDMPKHASLDKILNNIKFSSGQIEFATKGKEIKVKQH